MCTCISAFLAIVCSHGVIRGLVHHNDTQLVHKPTSEVVAVCLKVVVVCTGCCVRCQKSSRDETMSAARMCHNYLLALFC